MAKKKKKDNGGGINYLEAALGALNPYSFNSPFGATSIGNNVISYNPGYLPGQKEGLDMTSNKLLEALKGLNVNDFSIEDAYNNPFYDSTRELFAQPLTRQKEQDEKELDNRLNAMGQLGGSYEAYQRDLMKRRYDDSFRQNDLQARGFAYDAYNNQRSNQFDMVQGLRSNLSTGMSDLMGPMQMALGADSAVRQPYAMGQANLFAGGIRRPQTTGAAASKGGFSLGGAATGALSGAAAGASFGPWGAAIGGGLGLLGGFR